MPEHTLPDAGGKEERRSFLEFLQQLEDGALATDLTQHLKELVAYMRQQQRDQGGKPAAKLTIAIGFKLDAGVFDVGAQVTTTLPKKIRQRSLLYATRDNALTANNPKQLEMGLSARDVASGAQAELRAIR